MKPQKTPNNQLNSEGKNRNIILSDFKLYYNLIVMKHGNGIKTHQLEAEKNKKKVNL